MLLTLYWNFTCSDIRLYLLLYVLRSQVSIEVRLQIFSPHCASRWASESRAIFHTVWEVVFGYSKLAHMYQLKINCLWQNLFLFYRPIIFRIHLEKTMCDRIRYVIRYFCTSFESKFQIYQEIFKLDKCFDAYYDNLIITQSNLICWNVTTGNVLSYFLPHIC